MILMMTPTHPSARITTLAAAVLIAAGSLSAHAAVSAKADAAGVTAEQAKFFETKVRPLLSEHCYQCHGQKKQQANLRLDSLGAMVRGGRSGAAPGERIKWS